MTKNTEIEAWMYHPEAVLEIYKEMKKEIKSLQEQKDLVVNLYSKGCFTQLDDGTEYCVSGYAGGGSAGGILSFITISWTDAQDNFWFREYHPAGDWNLLSEVKKF